MSEALLCSASLTTGPSLGLTTVLSKEKKQATLPGTRNSNNLSKGTIIDANSPSVLEISIIKKTTTPIRKYLLRLSDCDFDGWE